MAILTTNAVTTTGYQFNNVTEFYNFLKLSSSLIEQEYELIQKYKNENKMIGHQVEFDSSLLKTKKYFDNIESATSYLNEHSSLFTNHSVDWEALKAEHGWRSVLTIDEANPPPSM